MTVDRVQAAIDAIDELVNESLARGPQDDFCNPWGRTTDEGRRAQENCEYCGAEWHGLPRGECEGAHGNDGLPDPEDVWPYYTVEIQVEVAMDVARNPREAALIALRAIVSGEVTCTVTSPDDRVSEVAVTA